jgi:hypothetical protein
MLVSQLVSMPTGYTGYINEAGATFEKFVMRCARSRGAFVMMREDPLDAPIPADLNKPSDYHKTELAKAEKEWEDFLKLSLEDAAKLSDEEYKRESEKFAGYEKKHQLLKKKYVAMLQKVKAWIPPTEDHEDLKEFMISQINQSIDHDCSPFPESVLPKRMTATEWSDKKRDKIRRSINYHREELCKEIQRCNDRNDYVQKLVASLK